jgi:integrase
MQRTYQRLSLARVRQIVAAGKPGLYPDGDGLYLSISKAGTASWCYRYMIAGRSREMGLGPVRYVGLAEARRLAYEARALKRDGIDPIEARRAKRQGAAVAQAKTMSFAQCARAYITAHQGAWSRQHAAQWVSSVENYCFPVFGNLPVDTIDTGLVMQVVGPLWNTATETASRVRGRIESVLDWAKVSGFRSGENPARWRGHLGELLPKKTKVAPVQHHAALDYREIAAFMSDLRAQDEPGMRALELAILCASRTDEVLAAPWCEFKLEERVWTIPAERMKGKKEHRVPLSDAAVAVLEKQQAIRSSDYVFAGRDNRPPAKGTLDRALKRLGRGAVTVHGFRSSFRDWAAEQTHFPREIVEMALAHKVAKGSEAAYWRGDVIAKRRALAEAWAAYCAGGAEVIDFPAEVRSA